MLYFDILHYFEHNSPEEYQNELEFLIKAGTLITFPYNRTGREPDSIKIDFDKIKKMFYVLHKNKRLYYPGNYDKEQAKQAYLNYIVGQNILDVKYSEKTPHQYTTDSFPVKNGDIVLDIGAAEGLFLLDVIEKVRRGFVFEPKEYWIKALEATFEPYKERVKIINKFVSNKYSKDELTIDCCLKDEYGNIFIKMDVEGYENLVLNGAKNVLNRKDDIRVACCTYHRHDDASLLENFFKDLNYHTEFSDGYMLFFYDKKIRPPYFRRGLIRAKKIVDEI